MVSSLVLFATTISSSSAAVTAPGTINAVIGDDSFRAVFGRAPTGQEHPDVRVATLLRYVEYKLRSVNVGHLSPRLRRRRRENLAHLRRYIALRHFPRSDFSDRWRPTFIDDTGRRCAVAYLLERARGINAIRAINRRYRNALVGEIRSVALARWAKQSGVSVDELAMIQPRYPPRGWHKRWRLSGQANFVVDGEPAAIDHITGVTSTLLWRHSHHSALIPAEMRFRGDIALVDGESLGYLGEATAGWRLFPAGHNHQIWVRLGAGIEDLGPDFHGAGFVPVDLSYGVHLGRNQLRVGGGPVARRAAKAWTAGWRARVVYRRRRLVLGPLDSRLDVYMAATYEDKQGPRMLGFAIGVGHYQAGYWVPR